MEHFPPRPKGKQTRFFIDNEYIEGGYLAGLPSWVFKVYSVLAKYAHAQEQTCYPSLSTISKDAGCNRNYVPWATRILEALNILQVERMDNEVNNYRLIDSRLWKPATSINIDTYKTVSKIDTPQYQKQHKSSINVDTRNHIKKSYKEIYSGIKVDTPKNDSIKGGGARDYQLRKIEIILPGKSNEAYLEILQRMKNDGVPVHLGFDPDVVRGYYKPENPKSPTPATDQTDSSNPE